MWTLSVPERIKIDKDGYIRIHTKESGFRLRSKVVMENKFGRLILFPYLVHHMDLNRQNDSEDNLQVITDTEHRMIHGSGYIHPEFYYATCQNCHKEFKRKFVSDRERKNFCSRRCYDQLLRDSCTDTKNYEIVKRGNNNFIFNCTCPSCGKIFSRALLKHQLKFKVHYCGRECAIKALNNAGRILKN